ncbi:FHIPEP family type III secretion protein [Chloroflexi bacterium TSY]|nr:FHIPEP family type III secretion protein [Chloroflexi bacterium TSY]
MLRIQLPDLFDRMKDNPEDLNSLTIVLKSLLKERVPIVAFEEIADEFMRLKNSNIGLIPITEAMRSIPKICPQLPGNNESYHFYQLDSKFEDVLNSNFNRSDSHAVLAIEPQQYQRFLASMRNAMTVQWNTALIVNNAFLRPFVKRLIANEFPDIPILSMRELRQDLSSRIVGKIGLL